MARWITAVARSSRPVGASSDAHHDTSSVCPPACCAATALVERPSNATRAELAGQSDIDVVGEGLGVVRVERESEMLAPVLAGEETALAALCV